MGYWLKKESMLYEERERWVLNYILGVYNVVYN